MGPGAQPRSDCSEATDRLSSPSLRSSSCIFSFACAARSSTVAAALPAAAVETADAAAGLALHVGGVGEATSGDRTAGASHGPLSLWAELPLIGALKNWLSKDAHGSAQPAVGAECGVGGSSSGVPKKLVAPTVCGLSNKSSLGVRSISVASNCEAGDGPDRCAAAAAGESEGTRLSSSPSTSTRRGGGAVDAPFEECSAAGESTAERTLPPVLRPLKLLVPCR
eukprot:6196488-Pleurochrysis_carterae.AAC.3